MPKNDAEQHVVAGNLICTRCGHVFGLPSISAICPKCAAPVELADPFDVLVRGVRGSVPWLLASGVISLPLLLVLILLRLIGPESYPELFLIILPLGILSFLCLIVGVVKSTPTRAMPPGRIKNWGRLVRLTLWLAVVVAGLTAVQPLVVRVYGVVVLLACLGVFVRALMLIFLAIYLDLAVSWNDVCPRGWKLALIVVIAANGVVGASSTVVDHYRYRASPELADSLSAITPWALTASYTLQVLTLLAIIALLLLVRAIIRDVESVNETS